MTECTTTPDLFPACKSRKVEVDFKGGDITSDAGSLLLRQADRKLGLTRDLNKVLHDRRRKGSCEHSQLTLLRQRIYGLALGYEDLNDHDTLRGDLAMQTAVESDKALASAPTLCRLENRSDHETARQVSILIVEKFIASFKEQQLDMFSDRTSCHNWWPNQLRLLLSSLAYILVESMRRLALKGTELARAQCGTIRLKLLKIGAVVIRNTRRVRMHLASGCPYKHLFWHAACRLALE
jgi:hypothetical protein